MGELEVGLSRSELIYRHFQEGLAAGAKGGWSCRCDLCEYVERWFDRRRRANGRG